METEKEKKDLRNNFEILKIEAMGKAMKMAADFSKRNYDRKLVDSALAQRLFYIGQAKTKTELKDIMKLSKPQPRADGTFGPGSPYHIEEEEMMLWSEMSLQAPLNEAGFTRYMELFAKYYPERKEEVLGRSSY